MSEVIASTESPTGGYEQVKYSNGANHVYEVGTDSETGQSKKIHISSDQLVRDMGHEPGSVPEAEPGLSEDSGETGSIEQENNDLRTEIAQLRGELSTQNQELTAQISALTGQIRALLEHLPPPSTETPAPLESILAVEDEPETPRGEPEPVVELPQEEQPNEQATVEQQPTAIEQQLSAAERELSLRRNELIEITIRRRARAFDSLTGRGRADAEAYQTAIDTYQQSLETYMQMYRLSKESADMADDEIRKQLSIEGFVEKKRFVNDEFNMNEAIYAETQAHGGIRAWRDRMVRKWAGYSKKKKFIIGITTGLVAGVASGPLGLGLVGIAAGSTVRFSQGLLSHRASAVNMSEATRDRELARIQGEQDALSGSLLHLRGPAENGQYADWTTDQNQEFLDKRMRSAKRRNRAGGGLMVLSAVGAGYGIAELAGAGHLIPSGWNMLHPGSSAHEVIPGSHGGDMSNFHPDSFYGRTPHEATGNMLDVFRRNGFNVRGDDSTHINALIEAARAHNVPIAIGMKETGHGLARNMVDASQAWGGHLTGNANASGLEGLSSVERWNQMRQLADSVGITITKGNA